MKAENIVIGIGAAILVLALIQWGGAYDWNANAFGCLFADPEDCQMVRAFGGMFGITSGNYSPLIFWAGAALAGVGLFLKFRKTP